MTGLGGTVRSIMLNYVLFVIQVCLGFHGTERASLLGCCGHSATTPMSSSIQHVQLGTTQLPLSAWQNEPHNDATLLTSRPEDPSGAPATSGTSAGLHKKRPNMTRARFTGLGGTVRSIMLNYVLFVIQSAENFFFTLRRKNPVPRVPELMFSLRASTMAQFLRPSKNGSYTEEDCFILTGMAYDNKPHQSKMCVVCLSDLLDIQDLEHESLECLAGYVVAQVKKANSCQACVEAISSSGEGNKLFVPTVASDRRPAGCGDDSHAARASNLLNVAARQPCWFGGCSQEQRRNGTRGATGGRRRKFLPRRSDGLVFVDIAVASGIKNIR
ncbi:hypothetical protein HPB51_016226 [Rhipicephalus microplus]|uniref:Uncharacterized protein n=1 Tax=Rhipicephalus microplus TaxID=6941 RepID=A0A9J6EH07_RHIMP|nr:hypothetical protein HPB51_016226 [Rhipicephalus microplus]